MKQSEIIKNTVQRKNPIIQVKINQVRCKFKSTAFNVRGVSWSLLTTVPERKLRRLWDMNFLWTAEKGVWKGWKRSDRKEKKRR